MAIKILNFDPKKNTYRYSGSTIDTYHILPKCHLGNCLETLHVLHDKDGYSIGCPIHGAVLTDRVGKLTRSPVELVIAYYTQLVNGLADELQKYIDEFGELPIVDEAKVMEEVVREGLKEKDAEVAKKKRKTLVKPKS